MRRHGFICFILLMALAASLRGDGLIQYDGTISDDLSPGPGETVSLVFSLYEDPGGTALLWRETHPVVRLGENGAFTAALGIHYPIPSGILQKAVLYLGVRVAEGPEGKPYRKILNTRYMTHAPKKTAAAGTGAKPGTGDCLHAANGIRCPYLEDAEGRVIDSMCVAGDYCIDEYETSADLEDGRVLGHADGGGTTGLARSSPHHPPQGMVSWFQAQKLCANAGKRLCTNAEWQGAASGTPDPLYQGDSIKSRYRSNCYFGGVEASARAWDDRDIRLPDCMSRFGVKDMAGNLAEWTADWMSAWSYLKEEGRSGMYRADPYNETQRVTNWPDADPEEVDPYDGGAGGLHEDTDDRMAFFGDAPNQYGRGAPYYRGFPSALFRGGEYALDFLGVFDMWLGQAVSQQDTWLGFRCCLTPAPEKAPE